VSFVFCEEDRKKLKRKERSKERERFEKQKKSEDLQK
jgi:hypothetical protein